MRCYCCNRNLSDYESTLKHPITGDFLDTCRKCLVDIPVEPVSGNVSDEHSYDEEKMYDDYLNEEEDSW